jgi:hypothetical protein
MDFVVGTHHTDYDLRNTSGQNYIHWHITGKHIPLCSGFELHENVNINWKK